MTVGCTNKWEEGEEERSKNTERKGRKAKDEDTKKKKSARG
jgi:hypothetical protein